MYIFFTDAPAKPSFYVNGDSVNAVIVVQDRNITVRCAAESNPSPSYSWASPYRTFSDASSSFSLINANVRNAGNYTCTAKNHMVASNGRRQNGSNSADISLSVQCELWFVTGDRVHLAQICIFPRITKVFSICKTFGVSA